MTRTTGPSNRPALEPQLEFQGCIIPDTSDKSKIPATLTREQTRQLAEIIFTAFTQWYKR